MCEIEREREREAYLCDLLTERERERDMSETKKLKLNDEFHGSV